MNRRRNIGRAENDMLYSGLGTAGLGAIWSAGFLRTTSLGGISRAALLGTAGFAAVWRATSTTGT